MGEHSNYRLSHGQILRYPRAQEEPPEYLDGYLNFRRVGKFANAGGFQMERGINKPAAVSVYDGSVRLPAIIISSSPYKKGSSETPWQDFFDPDNGHIRYFGDNKDPGKDPARAPGNKALLESFRLAHSHNPELRASAAPLLFFQRKKKGYAAFMGFGVIQSVDLLTQWDNKNQRSFTNYAFDFCVFNLEAEHEQFDWSWINSRRDPSVSLAESNKRAPKSWRNWITEGSNSLDRVRRRVSKLSVVKAEEQKPIPGSECEKVLNEVYRYFDGRKVKFEALAELIAERVIGSYQGIYQRGWITAGGGDGGADFVASVKLGSEFSSAKIIVLGQAKCVSPDSPTHGNHIARTVARLRRGWLGVFVTTSYFSGPVQQEVIEDRYPIVLIHGRRVAEEVIKILHDDERFSSVADFLRDVSAGYESRVQHRQPEEVLYL